MNRNVDRPTVGWCCERSVRTSPLVHPAGPGTRWQGHRSGTPRQPDRRRRGYDVLYVDHAGTATIRAKYAAHATVGEIVDVDVAWTGRLRDLVPSDVPIRWAIASHVIEHVPDLSSWLDEIAEVVEVGGILSLVVPDHRYCFDANRAPSRPSDVLGAASRARSTPSASQLVDYLCLTTGVDTAAIWRGESDHAERPANWQGGYELAARRMAVDRLRRLPLLDVHAAHVPRRDRCACSPLACCRPGPSSASTTRRPVPGVLRQAATRRSRADRSDADRRQSVRAQARARCRRRCDAQLHPEPRACHRSSHD